MNAEQALRRHRGCQHRKHLKKNQLVTINGKVMAVAFMANAQHSDFFL